MGLEAKMADSTTASCFLETWWIKIWSEADGNNSRSPETLSIEIPFQLSRNCHGFLRVTFRIASHDCTTEKSRDGFSEGKAKARRWSDLLWGKKLDH